MHFKKIFGALIVSAALPMTFLAVGSSAANAVSVSSEINTYDACIWALNDVPTNINLTTEEKFKGDAMMVATTIGPKIGFAGDNDSATDGNSKACSFYNQLEAKKLTIELTGENLFVATGGSDLDDEMDFALSTEKPLAMNVDITSENCTAPMQGVWSGSATDFAGPSSHDTVLFNWDTEKDTQYTYEGGEASRCAPEIGLKLEIPSKTGAPQGAGQKYSFVGPIMTFTQASND